MHVINRRRDPVAKKNRRGKFVCFSALLKHIPYARKETFARSRIWFYVI